MHYQVKRLTAINEEVKNIFLENKIKTKHPKIIAVCKTFSIESISPLIEFGHKHFGENKVQEAENKWFSILKKNNDIKLHMLGKLQTNKAKKAVNLFHYIHSLDNAKLAEKISKFELELNKKVNLFIQVNLADELQKSGVRVKELNNFYDYCLKELSLNIIGLMCIPPQDIKDKNYFKLLQELSKKLQLEDLSMGMSADYMSAIRHGATYIRLGTSIFGSRS